MAIIISNVNRMADAPSKFWKNIIGMNGNIIIPPKAPPTIICDNIISIIPIMIIMNPMVKVFIMVSTVFHPSVYVG